MECHGWGNLGLHGICVPNGQKDFIISVTGCRFENTYIDSGGFVCRHSFHVGAFGSALVLTGGAESVGVGSSRDYHSRVGVTLLDTLIVHDILREVLTTTKTYIVTIIRWRLTRQPIRKDL